MVQLPNHIMFLYTYVMKKNNIVAQADDTPRLSDGTERPTMKWVPKEVIMDVHKLTIPKELVSGKYFVYVGLYSVDKSKKLIQRLTIVDKNYDVRSDELKIGEVNVISPIVAHSPKKEFSDLQGENNWYYGFYVGDTFTQFPAYKESSKLWVFPDCKWLSVGKSTLHPCGDRLSKIGFAAAIRYKTNSNIVAEGEFVLNSEPCGDGVKVSVLVDGKPEFSQFLDKGESTKFKISASPLSSVDFVVDRKGNDICDNVWLDTQILEEDKHFFPNEDEDADGY